jgi:hypothetical protein
MEYPARALDRSHGSKSARLLMGARAPLEHDGGQPQKVVAEAPA